MIISDIDYLETVSETSTLDLNGARGAIALGTFSTSAFGSSTYTSAVVNNLAISLPSGSLASSSVQVTSIASGSNAVVVASASSFASTH